MTWKIRLFAAAAEAMGSEEIILDVEKVDAVRDVRRALALQAPALQELLTRSWFAVNGEYAADDAVLRNGDEIAVIPPVSGGMNSARAPYSGRDVAVVRDPLDAGAMYDQVASPRSGAVVVFAGTVREWTRERRTLRLEYHAYDEMAIAKLREVTAACQKRWPIDRIAVWHRVGVLEIGEISLLVGVSTPHRKDAYAASQFAVDMLKRIVPIWKKEWYEDGQVEWVGPDGPWNPVGEERTP